MRVQLPSAFPARPHRRLFSRRDPLRFKLFFVLVVVPIASIVRAPVLVFHHAREFVSRARYIELDGTVEQLQRAAIRRAPLRFRWFGRTLSLDELDVNLSASLEWLELKSRSKPGDKIWPFTINPHTLAMRKGFVVVRCGKPVAHVMTVVS